MRAIIIAAILSVTIQSSYATPADNLAKLSGMHERSNRVQLRKILGIDPARIPWCGAAVAWAVKKAGRKPPAAPLRAISWRSYGKSVTLSSARRGDVVVVRNRRGHHVALVTRKKGGAVCMVGGNQSNRISEKCVSARSIVAVRR